MSERHDDPEIILLERLHAAHFEERRRVARELHDLVANPVATALQNLELYALHRDTDPGRAATKLANALAALRESLDTMRALARDLRRSGAEDGIRAALAAYANETSGAPLVVRVAGDEGHVPPAVRGELFLVLREAVRNARLHSGARRVEVDVDVGRRLVRARVTDDGRGFRPAGPTDGTGLVSMRERVELLGGDLAVSSAPGRGTAVDVRVPLWTR